MTQKIEITSTNQRPLNEIAAFMVQKKPELLNSLDHVKFTQGRGTVFGSGEGPILKITIIYETITEADLADIEEILAHAVAGADDLVIERNEAQLSEAVKNTD